MLSHEDNELFNLFKKCSYKECWHLLQYINISNNNSDGDNTGSHVTDHSCQITSWYSIYQRKKKNYILSLDLTNEIRSLRFSH